MLMFVHVEQSAQTWTNVKENEEKYFSRFQLHHFHRLLSLIGRRSESNGGQ